MPKDSLRVLLILALINLSLSFSPVNAWAAANLCVKAGHPIDRTATPGYSIDRFSQVVMRIVEMMVSDPTKLRKEEKATVNKDLGRAEIQSLREFFGEMFSMRDVAPEGEVNLTSTMYMTLGKYTSPYDGKEKSTKVRFRRYFTQKIWDSLRQFIVPISKNKKTAKMEIKVQHPQLENVVVKLRVDVLCEDILFLSQADFFLKNKEALRQRIFELNLKESDRKEAELALDYLEVMYQDPRRIHEGLYAHTEYEREAFAIQIQPSAEAVVRGLKPIEVQITADTKVRLTRVLDQANFDIYGDDQIIYELKIPKSQAGLNPEDLKNYPGLVRVKQFQEWMQSNRDKSLPENKGKVSKVRSKKFRNKQKYILQEAGEEFLRRRNWISSADSGLVVNKVLNPVAIQEFEDPNVKNDGTQSLGGATSRFTADPDKSESQQGLTRSILNFLGGDL